MSPRDAALAITAVGFAVAAGFLGYSLTHLHELGIPITHPRVLVEACLAIGCGAAALVLASPPMIR